MSSVEPRARANTLEVPIFPLPTVQLFPHSLLPLHVFEPRYRALLRDCLAGNQLLAVATLEPGFENDYAGRPAVKTLCGLGRVEAHEALPDGRSNILLRGLARLRILEERPPEHAYRVVVAERLTDIARPGSMAAALRTTLVALTDQLARKLPSGATLRALARSEAELGPLTDVLSAALVTAPADRQRLLEELDVATRAELAISEIAVVLAQFSKHEGPTN